MIDRRTQQDVLAQIQHMAQEYVPNWRYNPDHPDAGTTLALIWANMLCGTIDRLNRVPENHKIALINALGAYARPAVPANGLIVFKVNKPVNIPQNTKISDANDMIFQTAQDLRACPAEITAIFAVNAQLDYCYKNINFVQHFNRAINTDSSMFIPLFSHPSPNIRICTIRHNFALSITKSGHIRLKVDCDVQTDFMTEYLSQLIWEYFDGENWCGIEVTVDNKMLQLEMPPCTDIRYHLTGAQISENINLQSMTILTENDNLCPDVVYSNDLEQTQEEFYPFGERFMVYDELYIACDEAFSKTGARVNIAFRMTEQQFEGTPLPEIKYKPIMKLRDFSPYEQHEVRIAKVAIEYFNGKGWAALTVDGHNQQEMFKHTDSVIGHISFTVPNDMDNILINAHDARYVRLRITEVENAFKPYTTYRTPYIQSVRLSYRFESKLQSISICQDMNEYICKFPMPVCPKHFPQTAAYFAFNMPFEMGTIFWEVAESVGGNLTWEYYTKDGWVELNVIDETHGLHKSGMLFYKTNEPCVMTEIFSNKAYWMRAVDSDNLYNNPNQRTPIIKNYWKNVVKITCTVGGERGNLSENSITQLISPSNGVEEAFNPFPTVGGYDCERDADVINRYCERFYHRDRAVTQADYINLAYEASSKVAKCACFPNTKYDGTYAAGEVCVAVLRYDYTNEAFEPLRQEIYDYIIKRCQLTEGRLHVVPPQFVAVYLKGRHESTVELRDFIDPISGGFDKCGWDIGTVPTPSQIAKALKSSSDLTVQKIDVSYTLIADRSSNTQIPLDFNDLSSYPFALPIYGGD